MTTLMSQWSRCERASARRMRSDSLLSRRGFILRDVFCANGRRALAAHSSSSIPRSLSSLWLPRPPLPSLPSLARDLLAVPFTRSPFLLFPLVPSRCCLRTPPSPSFIPSSSFPHSSFDLPISFGFHPSSSF